MTVRCLFSFLLLLATCSFAAEPEVPVPAPPILGLGVALSANGSSFVQAAPASKGSAEFFLARASVTNNGRAPISFLFYSSAASETHFVFKIVDAEGRQLWRSGVEPSLDSLWVADVLGRGKSWRHTQKVPLIINGQALVPGRYTLEAYLESEDAVGSSTVFEVMGTAPIAGRKGTLDGLLWSKGFSYAAGVFSTECSPLVSGIVRVNQILPSGGPAKTPFRWESFPNDGTFQVEVPVGRYRVDMQTLSPTSGNVVFPGFQHGTTTVQVGANKVVRPVVTLGQGDAPFKLVQQVAQANVQVDPNNSGKLVIEATGNVPTTGWTHPDLQPRYITEDGLLVLDFSAEPPSGEAGQAFTAVTAKSKVPASPWIKGIRIRGQSNTRDAWLPE